MKNYEARARREGDWWSIEVIDQIEGESLLFTQARRLIQVASMARDAIALLLDVDPDSFNVTVFWILDDVLEAKVQARRDARQRAHEAAAEAARVDAETARALVDAGLTVRDAGQVLGVAFQRVSQLVATTTDFVVSDSEGRSTVVEAAGRKTPIRRGSVAGPERFAGNWRAPTSQTAAKGTPKEI